MTHRAGNDLHAMPAQPRFRKKTSRPAVAISAQMRMRSERLRVLTAYHLCKTGIAIMASNRMSARRRQT
jgi:hypothetical protein